jgi:hypothetical protein
MAKRRRESQPAWTDVKARLANFDHEGLLGLIQDLYSAHVENRAFLYARFGLADDVLQPYKNTIEQWIYPDVLGPEEISVSNAKKAISDYKKAVDQPEGLVELMVFYCELATDFCDEFGMQDEGYYGALIRMFEQAIKLAVTLPAGSRDACVARLDRVRLVSHNFGYGIGGEMDFLFAEYTVGES